MSKRKFGHSQTSSSPRGVALDETSARLSTGRASFFALDLN